MKTIVSWSGGKDSSLALYKAMKAGHEPVCLLNFVSQKHGRCCFHGVPAGAVSAQAEALGFPLEQRSVPDTMEGYEKVFKETVRELMRKYGAEGMVFGDIYLLEQKSWVERVCGEIGITMIEPLWESKPEEIFKEFVSLGFKAVVVSAKADIFGGDFVGTVLDASSADAIKEKGACVCGENGEFHTFVFNGPIFSREVRITESEKVLKEGFWRHWFLDIRAFAAGDAHA
ncbi:MAG: diphthine--ammonia ligase [Endomicrobiales bacterium]|nr:diphthine--ammonia ligase [Endomicrobiales bacterium]